MIPEEPIRDIEEKLEANLKAVREYRKVREPDREKVGELVKAARGPERSVRTFADEMGVNASTVSRVENAKTSGVGNALLARVAAHADDLSGVTLENLLEANGMEKRQIPLGARIMESRKRFERTAGDVIRDELFKSGHTFTDAREVGIPAYHDYSVDLIGNTNAIKGAWMFEFMYIPEERDDRHIRWSAARVIEKAFQFMSVFYCGPGEIGKISIAINSKVAFDYVKESIENRLDGTKIKDKMSIILIDEDKRYVAEEWYIPTEAKMPEVFGFEPPEEEMVDIFNDPIEGQITYDEWLDMMEKLGEGTQGDK